MGLHLFIGKLDINENVSITVRTTVSNYSSSYVTEVGQYVGNWAEK